MGVEIRGRREGNRVATGKHAAGLGGYGPEAAPARAGMDAYTPNTNPKL